MFQEDYDPYREAPNQALLQELLPIYAKKVRTRADRGKMLDYAMQVLEDNPVDLRQLTNRIYVYEQNRKYDLARIWQYKLLADSLSPHRLRLHRGRLFPHPRGSGRHRSRHRKLPCRQPRMGAVCTPRQAQDEPRGGALSGRRSDGACEEAQAPQGMRGALTVRNV